MFKKFLVTSTIFIIVFALAACSSLPISGLTALPASLNQASTSTSTAITPKLGAGILMLEETEQAITKDQAEALLPLWKAVKSLGTDSTTAASEMSALYAQIQESLTSEQVNSIQDFTLDQETVSALSKKYASQTGTTSTAKTSTTRTSTSQSSTGPDGFGPGGTEMMLLSGGGQTAALGQTQQTSTVKVVQTSVTAAEKNNLILADSIVSVLQKKIDA